MEDRGPETQIKHKDRMMWPLIGLVVAAAILAAVVFFMPTTPKYASAPPGAQDVAQPNPNELQFQNIQLKDLGNGAAYLDGTVTNTGKNTVTGVLVELTFQDANGRQVMKDEEPLLALGSMGTDKDVMEKSLSEEPIKGMSQEAFRVRFAGVPSSWNHHMPGMRVIYITQH